MSPILSKSCGTVRVQETLNFLSFMLRNREDVDFILKGVGPLAIRGTEVTMAFCEAFLRSLNKSPYVVEKLLAKRWVIPDKEVTLFLSRSGRVHQIPLFQTRAVPQRASLTDGEVFTDAESALSSVGLRAAVQHTLRRLRRGLSPDRLARALTEGEAQVTTEGKGPPGSVCIRSEGLLAHVSTQCVSLPGGKSHRIWGWLAVLISLIPLVAHLGVRAQGYPCLCGGEDSWVKRARSAPGTDCGHSVQAQKEGSTKKLLSRALSCHCVLLKNAGRQARSVIRMEAIVVSRDCRKSSGDILGERGA
ncbi:uncharacterized protein O9250_013087 [Rhynochetos jubatus]